MAWGNLRREEQVGLALALVLHAALLGMFLMRPAPRPAPVPQPISVTLSQDTGLTATAPTHDAAADIAPTLGVPKTAPAPAPAAVEPLPVTKPLPEPRPVAVTPTRTEIAKPKHEALTKTAHKNGPSVRDWNLDVPATPDHQPAGGSRIGNDFLKGVAGGKASGKAQTQGAAVIGPEVKASLSGAIARQLKPHWEAPQGVDADKLVTVLSWDLDADGSLAGTPRVVRQEGITDSNRPQAARHAEQAIRAVELGAPFKLPPEYYAVWKHVRSFEFNRTLSQ
ncbi:MAG: hypothetical protein M3N34_02045 [Pseudomonadota bacterium]|nr:hypothetical protein [Pseudomonadota bacterium]